MTELGEKLKQARHAKGLSLDDLQQITKIQKRYLVAIEEGNYAVMPGKFYARAFIKQYAEAVDLNSEELFQEFENEVPATSQEATVNEQITRAQQRRAPLAASQPGNDNPHKTHSVFGLVPKILIGLFIVIIGFVIWYFAIYSAGGSGNEVKTTTDSDQTVKVDDSTKGSSDTKDKDTTTKKDTTKKDTTTDTKKEEPKKMEIKTETSGSASTYTVSNADKLALTFVVSGGESWIQVTDANGSSLFGGLIADGETKTIDLADSKSAKVTIGNATPVTFKINDQAAELAKDAITQKLTINLTESTSTDTGTSSDSAQ
ncbi:helix-turn-helix domain-containing protein [Listeria booriae]|uniref:Helix-turn-helix domain-containing protein n=1 Tax=Listeria booriae TaxID=1552123 RepID=A0A842AEW6_9LIST|nr:RodZ family helix-turn-helix domain-containing protein [Listeria booriae]MBC1292745.1 helix-turn-helix domain-containing protein [Listeria booriae]MBC1336037.1 helix-turn-helix domain-containing protein [Listeria booriae]MBC1401641.1 helix-turn-helix domain-containing protein [Listeria booriae]MBC1615112.1 helix-turn-helix domain-containing protein [Listeria booriae]MBC1918862.1 helix-turn-helix domain-containing protein [Listeria booriae]